MEIVIIVAIWSVIVKRGVEDIWHTARGGTPPRLAAAKARRSTGAAGRYWGALWDDTFDDMLAKHSERRARRQANPSTPRPRGAATQFFAGWFQDGRRAVGRKWAGGWTVLDEKRREKTTRPRPGQQTVKGKVVPSRSQRPPRLFGPWLFGPRKPVCSNCGTSEGVKWVGIVRPVEIGEYLCIPCHQARDCKYCADYGLDPSCPVCGRSKGDDQSAPDASPSRPQDGTQDGDEVRPQDEDGDRPDPEPIPTSVPDLQDGPAPKQDEPPVPNSGPESGPDQDISPTAPPTTQEGTPTMPAATTEVFNLDTALTWCEESTQQYRAEVVSADSTGAYCTQVAKSYQAQAAATEASRAGMIGGGVTGRAIARLTEAQDKAGAAAMAMERAAADFATASELATGAAADMEAAASELRSYKPGQEFFDSKPEAPDRDFLKSA